MQRSTLRSVAGSVAPALMAAATPAAAPPRLKEAPEAPPGGPWGPPEASVWGPWRPPEAASAFRCMFNSWLTKAALHPLLSPATEDPGGPFSLK